jgi:hypothetical protein
MDAKMLCIKEWREYFLKISAVTLSLLGVLCPYFAFFRTMEY